MQKLTVKLKADARIKSMWLTPDELRKLLGSLLYEEVEKLKIEIASVPVLPTQAENEARGRKDV